MLRPLKCEGTNSIFACYNFCVSVGVYFNLILNSGVKTNHWLSLTKCLYLKKDTHTHIHTPLSLSFLSLSLSLSLSSSISLYFCERGFLSPSCSLTPPPSHSLSLSIFLYLCECVSLSLLLSPSTLSPYLSPLSLSMCVSLSFSL